MLKNDILAIRLIQYNGGVSNKFYIYDINNKDSKSFSHSPINMIHRGKEEAKETPDPIFRINNFSIIENNEDYFILTDFFFTLRHMNLF